MNRRKEGAYYELSLIHIYQSLWDCKEEADVIIDFASAQAADVLLSLIHISLIRFLQRPGFFHGFPL